MTQGNGNDSNNGSGTTAKQMNRQSMESLQRKTVRVDLSKADHPELEQDGFCLLREMNGTERDEFEVSAIEEKEVKEKNAKGKLVTVTKRSVKLRLLRARLVALCLVDDTGERMYADDEVHQLSKAIPSSVIIKLHEAAQKLNGLDVDEEEAEKNLESDQQGDSTSSSPLH